MGKNRINSSELNSNVFLSLGSGTYLGATPVALGRDGSPCRPRRVQRNNVSRKFLYGVDHALYIRLGHCRIERQAERPPIVRLGVRAFADCVAVGLAIPRLEVD